MKLTVIHTAPDGSKIEKPVTQVNCGPDGTLQGILCADGSSYDGYVFLPERTDLTIVLS